MIELRTKLAFKLVTAIEEEEDGKPSYEDIMNYVEKREHPHNTTTKDKTALRRLAGQFVSCSGTLYWWGDIEVN